MMIPLKCELSRHCTTSTISVIGKKENITADISIYLILYVMTLPNKQGIRLTLSFYQ